MSVAARKLDRDALRPSTVEAGMIAVHRAANDDTYDKLGNLNTRTNGLNSVTETFSYDPLNRLTDVTSTAAGVPAKHYGIDAIGNITSKTGVGSYTYGGPRPHAVTSITPTGVTSGDANGDGILTTADTGAIRNTILNGTALTGSGDCNSDGQVNVLDILCVNARIVATTLSYSYDANGNMLSGAGRAISYTAFNMPYTVDYNGAREAYTYGPDYARLSKQVMTISSGTVTQTTTYLGKLYEHIDRSGTVEERFYISAGDRLVAEVSKGSSTNIYYIHTDLLGSAETVTDATKAVLDNVSFDAWGLARQANWQDGAPASAFNKTTRGYTGHETDVASGLVNMNARLYDPVTGRFLQADTVIPDVFNPQAFNPYSYVLNNPFGFTDPTGHDWVGTNNGVDAFNNGPGTGITATYNEGSGEYVFSDGSRIDAQGVYYPPSTTGNQYFSGAMGAYNSGVGPDAAAPVSPLNGSTGVFTNFGGKVTQSNTSPSYGSNSSSPAWHSSGSAGGSGSGSSAGSGGASGTSNLPSSLQTASDVMGGAIRGSGLGMFLPSVPAYYDPDFGKNVENAVLIGSLFVPGLGEENAARVAVEGGDTLRRFVRQSEFDAIQQAQATGNEVTLGRFFTPDLITDPRVAASQLAMPGISRNPIVGYVDVPISALSSEPLSVFGPRIVQPFRGSDGVTLPGLGLEVEFVNPQRVPSNNLRLVPTP